MINRQYLLYFEGKTKFQDAETFKATTGNSAVFKSHLDKKKYNLCCSFRGWNKNNPSVKWHICLTKIKPLKSSFIVEAFYSQILLLWNLYL